MLSAPNLAQVVEEVSGRWINGSPQAGGERILRVVIGAMTAKGIIDYLLPGALIITPGDRDDIILAAVASSGAFGQKGLSGIILTRDILPHPKILELLAQTTIPVIVAGDDSYSIASKINNMTVKTQPQDRDCSRPSERERAARSTPTVPLCSAELGATVALRNRSRRSRRRMPRMPRLWQVFRCSLPWDRTPVPGGRDH
jgi:hypothetical protein